MRRVYSKGFAVTCALEFLAAIVAIVLTVNYRLENKRRDSKYGTPHPNATVDTSELADQVRAYAMSIILQRRGLTVEVGSGLPLRTLTEFDEAGDDGHDENDLIHFRDDISGCCTSVSYCKTILLLRLRYLQKCLCAASAYAFLQQDTSRSMDV